MRKNFYLLTATLAFSTASIFTSAKDHTTGVSIRVGGAYNFNRPKVTVLNTTPIIQNNQMVLAAGVDYNMGEFNLGDMMEPGQKTSWGISADYYGNSRVYNIPILANVRGKYDQFDYSAGIGVGFGRAFDKSVKIQNFRNVTNVAFQLSGRYYIQKSNENPIFVEARYYGSSRSELNAIGIMVGVSF